MRPKRISFKQENETIFKPKNELSNESNRKLLFKEIKVPCRREMPGLCPVHHVSNQRFELSTGIFVLPESCNDDKQQVNGRTEEAKILNNRLDKICTRVQDVYNQLESKGEPFSALKVKNKLLGVSDEKGVLEILDGIINGNSPGRKRLFRRNFRARQNHPGSIGGIFQNQVWQK